MVEKDSGLHHTAMVVPPILYIRRPFLLFGRRILMVAWPRG
jgi:hypothetical protein